MLWFAGCVSRKRITVSIPRVGLLYVIQDEIICKDQFKVGYFTVNSAGTILPNLITGASTGADLVCIIANDLGPAPGVEPR